MQLHLTEVEETLQVCHFVTGPQDDQWQEQNGINDREISLK